VHCLRKKNEYCVKHVIYTDTIATDVANISIAATVKPSSNGRSRHQHCLLLLGLLYPSLLPSQATDVGVARWYCDCMITVAMSQLRPVASVKWGRVAIVPLRSSVYSALAQLEFA
jgi:hypothetical protein